MFPANFSSQKEYDTYLNCLANLKPGDKIEFSAQSKIEGIFLFKEQTSMRAGASIMPCYNILVGTENLTDLNHIFYAPSPLERRRFLSPAKKACPKILIGSTNIYWLSSGTRIEKIVKYNAVQEEKEKKEKAKAAKSLRARSKYA